MTDDNTTNDAPIQEQAPPPDAPPTGEGIKDAAKDDRQTPPLATLGRIVHYTYTSDPNYPPRAAVVVSPEPTTRPELYLFPTRDDGSAIKIASYDPTGTEPQSWRWPPHG